MTIQLLEGVILLVILVVCSNILNHYLPSLPTSLIQIGFGILLAFFLKIEIPLQTNWFLLLFVAPILFNDARTFPKKELWELRTPIIANAIILVLLTTLIGGELIHFLVPSIPLAASFALAAILSPTDPVAVNSITEQAKLPGWIMHLVAGESLINDASGLICFKYGVAATVTGVFSLTQATGDFFYISIIGAIIGAVLIVALRLFRRFLIKQGFNDVTILVVMQFSTPFLIYMVAEELHASGVIAVVVAGIFTVLDKRHYLENDPEYVIVTNYSWKIVTYILEGIIFLILGIELPFAMEQVIKSSEVNTFRAIGLVFIVWLFLFLIRVAWIYSINFIQNSHKQFSKVSLRDAVLSGLTGVRGTITMAGVLSLPFVLENGQPFPQRAMILFVASGVILLSLLMAVIFIPLITKNTLVLNQADERHPDLDLPEGETKYLDEKKAKNYLYTVAIQAVESRRQQDENQSSALDVIADYQMLLRTLVREEIDVKSDQAQALFHDEITLRRVALRGEASKLEELKMTGYLTPEIYDRIHEKLQQQFTILTNLQLDHDIKPQARFTLFIKHSLHKFVRVYHKLVRRAVKPDDMEVWAEKEMAKNAITFLSDFVNEQDHDFNRRIVYQMIVHYRQRIANLKKDDQDEDELYDQQRYQLQLVGFSAQRSAISDLVDLDRLEPSLANKLRQEINFAENTLQITTDSDD